MSKRRLLAGFCLPTLALLAVGHSLVAALPAADDPAVGPCSVETRKFASPSVVQFGSRVDISLALSMTCADETPAVHLVAVVDAFLDDGQLEWVKRNTSDDIRALELPGHPSSAGAVIELGHIARVLCPLTNDEAELLDCIARVRRIRNRQLHLSIRDAAAMLRESRDRVEEWRPLDEVISIRTSGETDDECAAAIRETRKATGQGIYVSAWCAGECDRDCLNAIVHTNPDGTSHPYPAPKIIPATQFARLHVTDTLPANMNLVAAGIRPPASAWDPVGRNLTWQRTVDTSQYTFTFQVEPMEVGEWPTNARAQAAYEDGRGRRGIVEYPVPLIEVLPGPGFPTPSPSPSPTIVATQSSGSPTETPTPIPSQTGVHQNVLYLPSVALGGPSKP